MGIASMVIGIFSGILGFIPLCNYFALLPAIVGLILGIVSLIKKSKENSPKGQSIAGVALNAFSIILIILWTMILATSAPSVPTNTTSVPTNTTSVPTDTTSVLTDTSSDTPLKPFALTTPEKIEQEIIPTEYKSALKKMLYLC